MQPKLVWEHGAGTFKLSNMPARTNISSPIIRGSVEFNQHSPQIDYDLLADKIAQRIEAVLLKFTGGLHAGLLAALESRQLALGTHPHYIKNPGAGSPIIIDESLLDVGVSSNGLESPLGQELTKPVITEDVLLGSAMDKLRKLKGK